MIKTTIVKGCGWFVLKGDTSRLQCTQRHGGWPPLYKERRRGRRGITKTTTRTPKHHHKKRLGKPTIKPERPQDIHRIAKLRKDGIIYPSAEHFFQAHKTLDLGERLQVAQAPVFQQKSVRIMVFLVVYQENRWI